MDSRTETADEIVWREAMDEDAISVLHVDDDESFLELVRAQLERRSEELEITTVSDAREALGECGTVDCVVSDYDMPGMDGLEFLERVREEYPNLPFILYTGKGSEEIASEAISAGVTDYLEKETGTAQYGLLYNRILNAVEQYRTERAFKYGRKRYRSLVEGSPHAVCLVQEGRIVYANEAFRRLVGARDVDQLYGTEYVEFVHPDYLEEATERMERIENRGVPVDRQTGKITTLDGEVRDVEVTATPISYNETIGTQVVIEDITELKRREQRLEEEKERFQKVFEQSHDAIMIVDMEDEEFLEVNSAACEMLDYRREELLELHPEDIHPSDIDRVREEFISQVLEEGSGWTDQMQCLTKHGELVPTEISGAVLDLDADDSDPTTMVAILRDVSEREAYREDLEDQIDRLDSFATVASHDLRNPLNVATGHLEIAREEFDSEHLDTVADALDRMETLISDMLTYARGGQTAGDIEPVSLDALAQKCWETEELSGAGATLRAESGLTVRADRSRLRQVLVNLLRNSVEHGSTSSRPETDDAVEDGDEEVTVTVGALDDGFYVEDTGTGIPPEERDEVFDLGYSTASDGTGFGLTIVRNIVEDHGWTVAVTEGETGGARFEITGVETE